MIKRFTAAIILFALFATSCITRENLFDAKSDVLSDGSITRTGSLTIKPAEGESGTQDSTEAFAFYDDNYKPLDNSVFEVSRTFADGVLKVTWTSNVAPEQQPFNDYFHKKDDGPVASNSVLVTINNRWLYKDYAYSEIFKDTVDTEKYASIIDTRLEEASAEFLDSNAMRGLKERDAAKSVLDSLRISTGSSLLVALIANPGTEDSLSNYYDAQVADAGDILSGLSGVKLGSDSTTALLRSAYDTVWDSLMTEFPDIFGSYGFIGDEHKFVIEVTLPGCLSNANADSTGGSTAIWRFSNLDFFGKSKTLSAVSRDWIWTNVILTLAVVLILLALVLLPLRRRRTA